MSSSANTKLTHFYGALTPSFETVREILRASGVDPDQARAADLYERDIDCHNLGMHDVLERIVSTVEEYGPPARGDRVLDVGCGMGGPGRLLADRFDCDVVGIDLLPGRVALAEALTALTNQEKRISYRIADATNLSDPDDAFTQAWMLDVSIHVRTKRQLFRELARVLRPEGLLVVHEQTGPLPDSMNEATRLAPYHAPTLGHLVELVEDAGFRVLTWRDTTPHVLAYFLEIQQLLGAAHDAAASPDADQSSDQVGVRILNGYVTTFSSGHSRTGMLLARRM